MSERALVIGEALVDAVRRPDGSHAQHPGGSPANVALGLGRLGREVDLLTWLGADADGDAVRAHLAASHVRVLSGDRQAARTPVATAHLDADGVATYEFDLEWDLPGTWEEPEGDPLVVHTGSIAAVLQPGGTRVAQEVTRRQATSTITYDPNLRPALMGSPEHALPFVDALVRVADVVKVSDEDLAWLHPGVAPAEIAEEWSRSGPALVVVTHGGEGAFASTSAGARLTVPAPKVQVADTVGAGDSFMGGLVDGLWSAGLLGADRREALRDVDAATVERVLERCARIAAITVSRPGANPPTSAELGD
ncbi:carbohydrate kinase family protein [Cellulomonas fimi]|uniref:PfkB domain protein n=1 Tax=Cellulomonas fimi (strain ATCC 484 / DSM 20113 / JCM 1341 / CCUG 24087 / LMG 16345 / NBRC 15513 / NCIMB 8980 / NCTC 7547 / NRS-133) TaxID=590998 RepID=F4H8N4_CELFA|nr:carbohydrate kinase [Cellulomonas fimi]AEE47042.1 PfkB domain protein [Cellulomonas fimi ATCC 484]NNH07785.1 carbohydrate kinase [Cellulomonas fimi]VEH34940.1 5-dehydro-2-deoxygluconokinase [Cellulomonas fimi]